MTNDRDQDIHSYLTRILPSGQVEELIATAGEAEAAGAPGGGVEAARKLARGEALNPRERFFVEAIIIPDKRPAIDIVEGDYTATHSLWRHLNEPRLKDPLRRAFRSIGRIELPGHPRLPYGGTGFIVGEGLLMTNRHVAEIFASGIGLRGLSFIPGRRAAIDFRRDRDEGMHLGIRGIAMIHPYWDMALLKVEGLEADQEPLLLSLTPPEDLVGRDIAVVGYPAFDPRNPADVQDQVFGGVYEVKRMQPGKIGARGAIESYGATVAAMTHDGSTLGGNSGSCGVDPPTGQVFALHFAGSYLVANYGVPSFELGRDGRVIDAGVRFAGMPVRATTPWDASWRGRGRDEKTPQPAAAAGAPVDAGPADDDSATFVLPLEVTLRWGRPALAGRRTEPAAAVALADVEKMVVPEHDTDYATRRGYDKEFLGLALPLPKPLDDSALARTADGDIELRYHHFSIAMHKQRRLALFTAANVDARPERKRPEPRPAGDYSRKVLGGLGKNDQERWFGDDRIRPDEQLPDRFFTKDRTAFDKGHLVRREDVCWGSTYDEVRRANGDTYHVTNCSPQVAGFNRSNTAESDSNWGDLENLVLSQADTELLSVFAGPVLDAGDRIFVGVDDEGPVQVQIPSRFWKVIVARKGAGFESFGFLLEQDLSGAGVEFAVSSLWRPFMVAIADLQPLAGIRFPKPVHDGDQVGAGGGESVRRQSGMTLRPAAVPRQGAAQPVAAADAGFAVIEPLLSAWRSEQRAGTGEGARFVLNFGAAPNDAQTARAVEAAFGLTATVGPLFDPDPELDRHRLLVFPGVSRLERSDMFEIARALRDLTGAETVDPDLATDYYDSDRPPPPAAAPESADFAFWCWAKDDDKPGNPDWALIDTKVPEAWAFSEAQQRPSRGQGIRVFQPDTGVAAHPELPANTQADPGAVNLIETGSPPLDPMTGGGNPGHGTGTGSVVASPVGGAMRGTAPNATLVPIRCVETVAVFNQSRVAKAIDHARRNGAHVITMSLGGVFSSALHAAVRKAVNANVIVMAAAGNCVGEVVWPARYDEAIAVGGTNEKLEPWRGSSHGSAVDISGPAEFVLRADARTNPVSVSGGQGTSFAVAHLAGVAALWLAHHGRDALIAMLPSGIRLQRVFRSLVRHTATVPQGFDTGAYGTGVTNARDLLARDPRTAFGHEAAFATPATDMRRQVAELVAASLGTGGLEAAAPALGDMQNAAEIACVALDRLRAGRTRRAAVEAMPPRALSPSLRRTLGPRAMELAKMGGHDARN